MQKARLLEILNILMKETDYEHKICTQDFCDMLIQKGYSCDRRTLSEDISDLNSLGYKIKKEREGKQFAYYYDGYPYRTEDLRVLIDAVQASSFIPEKRSKELIDMLSVLSNIYVEKELKSSQITFNTRKHKSDAVMYNVLTLNEAIGQNKKISFRYFTLNEKHRKKYKRNERYYENPISLVYSEDNYYLICYSDRKQDRVNFRVDRMDYITVSDEPVSPQAIEARKKLPDYTKQAFKMYDGRTETVTIRFHEDLLGPVYDKFGEDTEMTRVSDDTCETTVTVQLSPTFYGWLAQFGKRLVVTSPESVRSEMLGVAQELAEAYGGKS